MNTVFRSFLLFGLVAGCLVSTACNPIPTSEPPPPPEVSVATPVTKDVVDYAVFTGTSEESESLEVRARVQGFLDSVNFKEGQVVEKDAYCPRTALERRLSSRIERGQNTVVLGNRRVGKTSLICNVASHHRTHKVWYVDFLGIKSGQDFLTRGVQAMGSLDRHASVLDRLLKALPRLTVSISPMRAYWPPVAPDWCPALHSAA